MKKYVVYKTFDEVQNVWEIKRVETFDFYEQKGYTEEKLLEIIGTKNNDTQRFELINVEDEISDVFDFMIGNRRYKSYRTINDLYDAINDDFEEIKRIGDEISDLGYQFDDLANSLKEKMNELKEFSEQNI